MNIGAIAKYISVFPLTIMDCLHIGINIGSLYRIGETS